MSKLISLTIQDFAEFKKDLVPRGASSFDVDYELRLMLFVASIIDGNAAGRAQNKFMRDVGRYMGWSLFYEELLQGKIDKQSAYTLEQFRLGHAHPTLATILYRVALATCLHKGDLEPDHISFLKNIQDALLPSGSQAIQLANQEIGEWFSKDLEEISAQGTCVIDSADDDKTLEDYLEDLDRLVGLDSVKEEVRRLISFIQIQKMRKAHELTQVPLSLHMVFTGNPGTGKTTVARLFAKIYRALGVLERGHLVETDRSGLVGQYVGHTAIKTSELVNSARGGVLFIDEAYSLAQGGETDFGQEAIDALVKRMEDYRDELLVIVAGYKDEMETFISANPGLRSRFSIYIEFADYRPDELLIILERLCENNEYLLQDDTRERALEVIEEAIGSSGDGFGNGRFVRNLFESMVRNQAMRLSRLSGDLDRECLSRFLPIDLGR